MCAPEVPSGLLHPPTEKHLSGHCYLSEPLLLHFDQFVSHPEWEQIAPSLLPLFWASCCVQEVPAQCLISSFVRGPHECGWLFLTSAWLSTQTNSLTCSESIWVTAIMAHLFSHLQMSPSSPISLVLSQPVTSAPARVILLAVCLLLPLYPSSDFKRPGLSWHGSVTSLLWEGWEPLSSNH